METTTPAWPGMGRWVRLGCWLGLGWILLMGASSILLHYQVDPSGARNYFSEEEIEIGLDYAFERKWIGWTSQVLSLAFLAILVLSPLGPRMVDRVERLTGQRWAWTVLLLGGIIYLGETVLSFPFAVLSLYHRRAWGMTERPFLDWLLDYGKGLAIGAFFLLLPLLLLYLLVRWRPRSWWVLASIGALLLGMGIALLYPVLVDPLFNTFTPLSQSDWSKMEPKVRALLDQAELPVQDILVMDASRQGRHTNAFFTGFGGTRRIILYDTLLRDHKEDEVLVILAHEIGHWQHDHIVKGLALGGVGVLAGCFLLSRILLGLVGRPPWRLRSPGDPAGVPLVLLLFTIASWVSLPVQNLVSRYFESQADQTSLELTDQADAYIRGEVQMGRSNKSNVVPHPLNVWIFNSHPPVLERIERGRSWNGRNRD